MTFEEHAKRDNEKSARLAKIRKSVDAGQGIPADTDSDDLEYAKLYKKSIDRANAFLGSLRQATEKRKG